MLLFLCVSARLCAQDEELRFGNTPMTNKYPTYESNDKHYKEKQLIYWVKNDARGLLEGNPCMDEVTRDMGFVYLIQPQGQTWNNSEFERLLHNFGAKFRIMLKNGPFWKFKLKRERKRCRELTGDFVG